MASYNVTDTTSGGEGSSTGHVRGSRRQKVYGYLKAANEIRQSYQAQFQQRGDDEGGIPGAFPDVEIVRSGDEEMVLFPSYARKHIKKLPPTLQGTRDTPGARDDIEHPDTGDADYWKREWEKYEDDNAVVDVDVRGWIYSPHRSPLNRKNRLLVAVARRLSGVPAPTPTPDSYQSPEAVMPQDPRRPRRDASYEDEAAVREAQTIIARGEAEAKAAWQGGYSENPSRGYDSDTPPTSGTLTPQRSRESLSTMGRFRQSLTDTEMASEDEDPGNRILNKRASWAQPVNMSPDELKTANRHLMSRLKPFMTVPLANTTITIFFFNDNRSQSRTVQTNDSGHFNIRASLDFIPTDIRVLASESLSATEKVHITGDKGISLVSDIDDTIKHSAISNGAREIFKNTFIRELGDLTIQGVKEWYTKMSEMGVTLHYVSNSPWQLYPLLRSYFSLAGLPAGSFHLKHYTGMLQGIFEPAAERKRGSLEKIMHDFPERKFILVGDSGEADLEVYSDVVAENPGRVLAVFIRDVTTPTKKKFFDQSVSNTASGSRVAPINGTRPPVHRHVSNAPERRPALPERRTVPGHDQVGDLIDFEDDAKPTPKEEPRSYSSDLLALHQPDQKLPPTRPSKPSNLRGSTIADHRTSNHDRLDVVPQRREPSRDPSPNTAADPIPDIGPLPHRQNTAPSSVPGKEGRPTPPRTRSFRPHMPHRHTSHKHPPPPQPVPKPEFYSPDFRQTDSPPTETTTGAESEGEGYAAAARRQIYSTIDALPSITSTSPTSSSSSQTNTSAPPRPPPRKGLTSYPVAAARYVAGTAASYLPSSSSGGNLSTSPNATNMSSSYTSNPDGSIAAEAMAFGGTKKEDLWRRRWARAEELMRAQGVLLRTWRVGGDVVDDAVRVVERGREELEREGGRRGGVSLVGK